MPFTGINVRGLAVRVVINAAALWVADALIDGIRIAGWQSYAVMAIVLALANSFAKPVLRALSCPLLILTLGLFALVINTVVLGLSAWVARQLGADVRIDGVWPALAGVIIMAIVGWLLSLVLD